MSTLPAVVTEANSRRSRTATLWGFIRSDSRAQALVAAFGASLLMNVANVVPFLGPVVDLLGDVGFEALAMVLAASILKRDARPLRALMVFGGLGLLKTALDGLNLLPELGSLAELGTELGIDLTQVWFLKEAIRRARP